MAVMSVTIVRNAAVLDPDKGELAPGQTVVVEGGRIADIGPGLTGPDDAVVLDAAGRTVMPGLIDAHTHPAIVDHDVFGLAEWPPTYVAARASKALAGILACIYMRMTAPAFFKKETLTRSTPTLVPDE